MVGSRGRARSVRNVSQTGSLHSSVGKHSWRPGRPRFQSPFASGEMARHAHHWYVGRGIIRPSGQVASSSGSVWQRGAVYMPGYGVPGEESWNGKIQASGVPGPRAGDDLLMTHESARPMWQKPGLIWHGCGRHRADGGGAVEPTNQGHRMRASPLNPPTSRLALGRSWLQLYLGGSRLSGSEEKKRYGAHLCFVEARPR